MHQATSTRHNISSTSVQHTQIAHVRRTGLQLVPGPDHCRQFVPECLCSQYTHELQQLLARNVIAHARQHKGEAKRAQARSTGPQQQPAAADGLLQVLVQLASRSNIILGSHQAYAHVESLEVLLPQQLHTIPTPLLASGLWAMARLQLQPQQELIAAVAAHLLQEPPQRQQQALWDVAPAAAAAVYGSNSSSSMTDSNGDSSSSSSEDAARQQFAAAALRTRLGSCAARDFGGLCYSLNFFLLRDPSFWATAAAVALKHLQQLKPSALSNLLQGLALSGWLVNPGALGPQQVSSSRLGVPRTQPAGSSNGAGSHSSSSSSSTAAGLASANDGAVAAVLALLQALEAQLLSQPRLLRRWRLRDISQLTQAYALLGYRCGRLFAAVAQHLLEEQEPLSEQLRAQQQQHTVQQQQQGASRTQQLQQQMLQRGASTSAGGSSVNPSSSVLAAAYPSSDSSSSSGGLGRLNLGAQGSGSGWGGAGGRHPHDKGGGPGRLQDCSAADAVGIAWAFVHAFCPNKLLLHELSGVLVRSAGQLHAADVSRLLWAYAVAGVVEPQMLVAVTAAVCEEMHGVVPRTAAGAVWALGSLRFQAPPFLEAAYDRLADCLEATPVQQQQQQPAVGPRQQQPPAAAAAAAHAGALTLTAVPAAAGVHFAPNTAVAATPAAAAAVATAVESPSVLQQLYQGADTAKWLSGGPQAYGPDPRAAQQGEVALMRTLTQLQQDWQQRQQQQGEHHQQEEQLSSPAIAATTSPQPQQQQQWSQQQQWPQQQQQQQQRESVVVTPRDVAEAVWAAGRLQHFNATFFAVLRPRFPGLLPGFTDTQLVDVLWGLAKLDLYDEPNMDAAAEEVLRRVRRLPASGVALTAWAFARLRHNHPRLLAGLADRALQLVGQGQVIPKDAWQLLYAAARLGVPSKQVLKACSQVLKPRLHNMGTSMLVTSLWAAAVAGHFDDQLFAGTIASLRQVPVDKFKPLQLLQIFQATTLMQDAMGPAAGAAALQLPPLLAAAVKRQWLSTTRRSPVNKRGSSSFAAAVAWVLREQLGLRVDQEQQTQDGLFSIDLALTWDRRRVAVEVDGPEHFTVNTPYTLLGSTRAKHSCLQHRGWAVLSIPFYEWNDITAQVARGSSRTSDSSSSSTVPLFQQQQQQQQLVGSSLSLAATAAAAAAPAADKLELGGAAATPDAAAAMAAAVGLSAQHAQQLAAARAAYLTTALDRAVATADMPRSLLQQQ